MDLGTSTLYFLIERKVVFLLCKESGFTVTYGILSTKINFAVQLTHNNTALRGLDGVVFFLGGVKFVGNTGFPGKLK